MSKKNNPKKKVTVKLSKGESFFIANVDVLNHIVETYLTMADQCEDKTEKDSWLMVAQDVHEQMFKNANNSGEYENEEEW